MRFILHIFTIGLFVLGCVPKDQLLTVKHISTLEAKIDQLQADLESSSIRSDEELQNHNKQLKKIIKELESIKSDKNSTAEKPVVIKPELKLENKLVVGSIEKVRIYPSDFEMEARIDTGAGFSSIDAREIEEFERDGKKWVRFIFPNRSNGEQFLIETPVARFVKISQSSVDDHDRRIMVLLKLTIGEMSELVEFTLTDREHMSFGVLVGRNAIKDTMIVDVSGDFLVPLGKPE